MKTLLLCIFTLSMTTSAFARQCVCGDEADRYWRNHNTPVEQAIKQIKQELGFNVAKLEEVEEFLSFGQQLSLRLNRPCDVQCDPAYHGIFKATIMDRDCAVWVQVKRRPRFTRATIIENNCTPVAEGLAE